LPVGDTAPRNLDLGGFERSRSNGIIGTGAIAATHFPVNQSIRRICARLALVNEWNGQLPEALACFINSVAAAPPRSRTACDLTGNAPSARDRSGPFRLLAEIEEPISERSGPLQQILEELPEARHRACEAVHAPS
jgi:hypothetical protein